MERKIKFSVIIPVYNVENYLKECLDSVLSYRGELEVIAVDDGSTDSSGKMLDEYPDERLKVFHKENEGLFRTWKYGVGKSTGEYIVFVDSDDYIDGSLFPDMLKILSKRDYDLIQFGWTHVSQKKSKRNVGFNRIKLGALEGEELQNYLDETLYRPKEGILLHIARWGKVYRAELLKALLPELMDDINMFEDQSMTLPYFTTIKSLYITDKPYYFYRIGRPGSICNDHSKILEKWQDAKNVNRFLYEFRNGALSKYWDKHFHDGKYTGILMEAVVAKEYELSREFLKDESVKLLLRNGLKCFLIRHEMFRTYNFLRKGKNLFRH